MITLLNILDLPHFQIVFDAPRGRRYGGGAQRIALISISCVATLRSQLPVRESSSGPSALRAQYLDRHAGIARRRLILVGELLQRQHVLAAVVVGVQIGSGRARRSRDCGPTDR
jgi:hypothetical protein